MLEKCKRSDLNVFSPQMNNRRTMAIERIKIVGAVLELPARQQCQSSPFPAKIGLIGTSVWLVVPKWPTEFTFFIYYWCQTFILSEIHSYLSALKSWHNNLFLNGVTAFNCLVLIGCFRFQIILTSIAWFAVLITPWKLQNCWLPILPKPLLAIGHLNWQETPKRVGTLF